MARVKVAQPPRSLGFHVKTFVGFSAVGLPMWLLGGLPALVMYEVMIGVMIGRSLLEQKPWTRWGRGHVRASGVECCWSPLPASACEDRTHTATQHGLAFR